MSAGVITIERKKYAVGLFWQPLPAGQNTRDFAKQLSKQLTGSVKFYAEFRSMIGVGTRALGHRRGMKIAAIEVINSFPEYNSFLVEFFYPARILDYSRQKQHYNFLTNYLAQKPKHNANL